jgi:hypothetical protein
MADALEFTTTPKERPEEGVTPEQAGMVPVTIDGERYWAKKPKDAVVAQLGPVMSRRTNSLTKVQLTLDFLEDCMVEPGRSLLRARLLDDDDDFDVEDAVKVLRGIAEYWKANPPAPANGPGTEVRVG